MPGCSVCVSTSWMCGPDSDKSLGAGPSRGCHRCPDPSGCQTSHPSSSKASATVLNAVRT